jgi:acetyl-CoA synthetase
MTDRHGQPAVPPAPPPPLSAWAPPPEFVAKTNVAWLMARAGVDSYAALHAWSVENREAFWAAAIERVGVRLRRPWTRLLDLSAGVESPRWLDDARLNVVESCFQAPPDSPAIVHQTEGGTLRTTTVGELAALTDRVAANVRRAGYAPGTALAILMPMTAESVAIYLGIVKAGFAVVGIADSFSPREVAGRLGLSNAAAVFTQDVIRRGGRALPLYEKAIEASAPPAVVLAAGGELGVTLRQGDQTWAEFLGGAGQAEAAAAAEERGPDDVINLLFSSGTTGDPKVIPWTQATPIKCAVDAHFHQDVRPGDVLVWPTNLGWMMGPWLIFAGLMNRATIGLYDGAPTGRPFGQFVQDAKATMLGVVPSLVKAWRASDCMLGLDWSAIRLFSSTGECSSADDMAWLSSLAGGRPVVEYCGGTEIGGGYLTGTVTLPCVPGTFNTPALGLDVVILDDDGRPADSGELFIVPPSIGLSTRLLNRDHHEVYFTGTPLGPNGQALRRHGDQVERLLDGRWRALGRADDTMNLGGIKVSSAELERVVGAVPGVVETAAIAVAPGGGGPSMLVVYAVCAASPAPDEARLAADMRAAVKRDLNPLFKIHDVVLIDALPRTTSNKVMRRVLRDRYQGTR